MISQTPYQSCLLRFKWWENIGDEKSEFKNDWYNWKDVPEDLLQCDYISMWLIYRLIISIRFWSDCSCVYEVYDASVLCFLPVLLCCEVPQSLRDHRVLSVVLLFSLHMVLCISFRMWTAIFLFCQYLYGASLLHVLFSIDLGDGRKKCKAEFVLTTIPYQRSLSILAVLLYLVRIHLMSWLI